VASPGDVVAERRLAQEVLEGLPHTQPFRGLVTVEVFRYEDERAQVGLPVNYDPQEGITRSGYRPADCDFTVAFLWSRMGTPLSAPRSGTDGGTYASGTEWEIEDALRGGKEVFLYVNSEPPAFPAEPNDDDPATIERRAQYRSVQQYLSRYRSSNGGHAGAISSYSSLSELRERFTQNMSGVLRRRLDAATKSSNARRSRKAAALAIGAALILSCAGFVINRTWMDHPRISVTPIETCELFRGDAKNPSKVGFELNYSVTHHRPDDAAYVEISDAPSFGRLLYVHKQPELNVSGAKDVLLPVDRARHSWSGWLRITVKDDQLVVRATSPVLALNCREEGE
jgi:hypothetical protein